MAHKLENVLSYVPQKQQPTVEPELKALFYQADRAKADQAGAAFVTKFEASYPTAVACLKRDLEACLTFCGYPAGHLRAIRTNNVIERLFGEIKRRSKKMGGGVSE